VAIERNTPATPIEGTDALPEQEELSISIDNPDSVAIATEDGGMIIDFDPESENSIESGFNSNLADLMSEDDLNVLGGDLISQYQADKDSRSDWEETYVKGLDQLGLKIEERTTPWAGACGVFHPMLSEAVIRFQSQSIAEMFPAQGPVRTKIVGKMTEDKTKQAGRVQDYLNFLLTYQMSEYRTETEKMLFSLPLAGSAFRKVYYDPNLERPASLFVPAEDVVVNYGASDLETCQRATHVMHKSTNEIRKNQVAGFYRDIDIPEPSDNQSDIRKKYDEMTGESNTYNFDDRHTLLEMQVDLDLEGFEDMANGEKTGIALPYVVTIDFPSGTILSIRRNYYENDPKKLRRMHFVHYQYLPGLGFYGFGLIHMVGGLAKSATSILRQLVDAGTLSNLPGGLKARGLRVKGDDTPIMPGEFRDVDVPGGAIRDNITFLPYKEPSQTLYQLLQNIVEEGRRFASMNDMKVSDMNNQAPVGTTLALLERNMKVMSAVQARLHASMRKEFEILVGIVKDFTEPSYPYEMDEEEFIKVEDFDERIDVLPVSDPNASTMAQRIMQYQAAMQLATTAPQIYNMPELHRQMLETLGIRNVEDIIPDTDDIKPVDPVTAVQNLINGQPVKAFPFQDHEAHIETIVAAQQNPEVAASIEQSPNAQSIVANASAYVNQHLTMKFRKQVEREMGIELPPEGQPIPPDVEKRISELVAEAAQRVAITSQAKEQQERIAQQQQDPLLQMKDREIAIKEAEVQRKIAESSARLQLDSEKAINRDEIERERIQSQEQIAGAKLGQQVASDLLDVEESRKAEAREDFQKGIDIARQIVEDVNKNE
jgi:hypothetical protein|tara:strand:- start:9404 stop:11884 length:2481 start_codon:yes stop_codon:yes gene_type:complete